MAVLKPLSERADDVWCDEMAIPVDMWEYQIGDELMITHRFRSVFSGLDCMVGDIVSLGAVVGNNFAVRFEGQGIFTTALMVNEMRQMYVDSTDDGIIALDDIWSNWDD